MAVRSILSSLFYSFASRRKHKGSKGKRNVFITVLINLKQYYSIKQRPPVIQEAFVDLYYFKMESAA